MLGLFSTYVGEAIFGSAVRPVSKLAADLASLSLTNLSIEHLFPLLSPLHLLHCQICPSNFELANQILELLTHD